MSVTVAGAKDYITIEVPYIQPGIDCEVLSDQFDFDFSLDPGFKSWQFGNSDRNMTMNVNVTIEERNHPGVQSVGWLTGNMTVVDQTRNWSLSNLDLAWNWLYRLPEDMIGPFSGPPRTIATIQPYGMGCYGPAGWNETAFLDDFPEEGCASDNILVMVRGYNHVLEPGANEVNMSVAFLECKMADDFGRATIRVENTRGDPIPDIIKLDDKAWEDGQSYRNYALFQNALYALADRYGGWTGSDFASGSRLSQAVNTSSLGPDVQPWDGQGCKAALEAYYRIQAVQVIHSTSLAGGSNATISGILDTEISRLTVTTLAFWLMASFLATMVFTCAFLVAVMGRDERLWLRQDPKTLASTILLLRHHPQSREILRGMSSRPDPPRTADHQEQEWWRPWGTTLFSKYTTIAAVAVAIGLLELTFRFSSDDDDGGGGLVLVTTNGWTYYGWTMVPTFLATILGLMISAIDFNIRLVTPFSRLANGGANSVGVLFEDYIFGALPYRIGLLVRTRCRDVVLSTLGTMMMPFTLVVIGDLFVTSSDPSAHAGFSLWQSDGFDAGVAAKLNLTNDPPFSPWAPGEDTSAPIDIMPLQDFTTDKYAMGSFLLPEEHRATDTPLSNSVTLTTTVTTGKLNCTAIEMRCKESRIPAFFNRSASIPCSEISFDIPTHLIARPGCPESIMISPQFSYARCYEPDVVSLFEDNMEWTGTEEQVELEEYEASHGVIITSAQSLVRGSFGLTINDDYDQDRLYYDDCPTVMRTGEEVYGDCEATTLNVALCDPYLEAVEADVVLSLPELTIKNITEKTRRADDTQRTKHHIYGLGRYLTTWQNNAFNAEIESIAVADNEDFAPVFITTLSSKYGNLTRDDLWGRNPDSHEKLTSAIEALWARAVGQIVRAYAKPFAEYDPPKEVTATLMDSRTRWLRQNETPTRLLQGILGWTAVFLTAAFVLGNNGRMDRVLPAAPTSIGALFKLLEGSKIMRREFERRDGRDSDIPKGEDDDEKRGDCKEIIHIVREVRSFGSERTDTTGPIQKQPSGKGLEWLKKIKAMILGREGKAEYLREKEIKKIFDVPGRVYCLKEWDDGDMLSEIDKEEKAIACKGEKDKEKDDQSDVTGQQDEDCERKVGGGYRIDFEEATS